MIFLRAQFINCFPTNEFKDKVSGEVTPPGHKVQLQYKEPVNVKEPEIVNGKPVIHERFVMREFNIHQNGAAWLPNIGKVVQVQVMPYVDDSGKVQFYLHKDAKPVFSA
jgi:hypothetical protein